MSDVSMSLSSQRTLVGEERASGRETPAADGPEQESGLAPHGSLSVSIEVISDMASVAVLWSVFEKLADCTPFQIFGWLDQWQRHIGARKNVLPVIVVGRGGDGGILFILPLALEKRGPLRRLTWLGMELGDYCGPLLAEGFSRHASADDFPAVWDLVLASLHSDAQYRFDLADLAKMPEMIGTQKNPFLRLAVAPNRSSAYLAALGADWASYFNAKRSASTRKTLRKKQRHLEALGKISFAEDLDAGESVLTLETLIEQKSRAFSRMGVENIFARPGYPEFYAAVVSDPEMRDMVHVCHLDVGVTTAAASVALRFRDRYYLILSSYHDGEMSRFGPGRTHLHELLRYTIGQGFRQFDFTIGDEPYKLDWSDTKLTLYDHLAAFTWRGWLFATVIILQRRTISFIKQTPALWRLALKIRSLMWRWKGRAESPIDAAD